MSVARSTHATPFTDRWRELTRLALSARGRRAALARSLAQSYGGSAETWVVQLCRVLNHRTRIDMEIMMAVDAWLVANPSLRKDGPHVRDRREAVKGSKTTSTKDGRKA